MPAIKYQPYDSLVAATTDPVERQWPPPSGEASDSSRNPIHFPSTVIRPAPGMPGAGRMVFRHSTSFLTPPDGGSAAFPMTRIG